MKKTARALLLLVPLTQLSAQTALLYFGTVNQQTHTIEVRLDAVLDGQVVGARRPPGRHIGP